MRLPRDNKKIVFREIGNVEKGTALKTVELLARSQSLVCV